jgi:hypothetical protein
MVVLEVECNMLRNMVINLSKGDQSRDLNKVKLVNSNCEGMKEEETMHQLHEDMEIIKQELDPVNATMEEETKSRSFC